LVVVVFFVLLAALAAGLVLWDDACYFENKAYFTKRGLKKRIVLHMLYHHLVKMKGLVLPERIEEKQANGYANELVKKF